MATTAFAATQQLQGLIALNAPSYVIKGWHSTLFTIGITIFAILWNTVFVRTLPLIEGFGLILHVFGFIAFVIVLWLMGSRSDTKHVWTSFEDNNGWGSPGVATLVGILGPIVTLIGSDSSCHLAEELKDAAWILPRAMVATALVNYSLGFVMTVTIMSTLGNDIHGLLTTPLGQPWIQVLLNATDSIVGTSIMIAILCFLLLFCSINSITTASRQLFAFARDKGLPFSNFLAQVREIPNTVQNLLLIILQGSSWMGRPCQRNNGNIIFHNIAVSYHYWFNHRLQYHYLTWASRSHLILFDSHWLYLCKAYTWRNSSSLSVQSWQSWNCCQRDCDAVPIPGVCLLLVSCSAKPKLSWHELELSYLRFHSVLLVDILSCLWEAHLCWASRVCQTSIDQGFGQTRPFKVA
jgi:hypothetical protein